MCQVVMFLKTVYINEKKLNARKIRKITKKVSKINKKEEVAVAISNNLIENEELVREIEKHKIQILNRKVAL